MKDDGCCCCRAESAAATRSGFFRHGGAAGHGTVTAFAAVVLHGVFGLALDDGDLAFAFIAGVFGSDGEPLLTSLAGGADMFGVSDHRCFAAFALHRDGFVSAYGLRFSEGSDWLGAGPVLDTGTSEGEGSERAEGGGREKETNKGGYVFHDCGNGQLTGLR